MNPVTCLRFAPRSLCVSALMLLSMAAPADSSATADSTAVNASWRSYELTFHFSSFDVLYNCYSFSDKLKRIFKQLGAREDVAVTTMGCFEHDLGNLLTSRINVAMPVAGNSSAADADFAAEHRTITLRSTDPFNPGMGDCEILEQLRTQVFPKLALKTNETLVCIPGDGMNAWRQLDVQALIATPPGK